MPFRQTDLISPAWCNFICYSKWLFVCFSEITFLFCIFILYIFFSHEDGSVNFWDVSQLEMRLIYTLNTAKYFVGEHEGHDSEAREAEEEVWPPFKKVGNYCPYSDDPRFAVTKIVFCASNKTMTVAGNGGQVLTFDLSEEETSVEVQV